MKKTAVFGGKFDPPHLGHQLAIFLLLEKYEMDEVYLMPSYAHPFGFQPAPFDLRVEMCEVLASPWQGSGRVSVRRDEQYLPAKPAYTVELLRGLKEAEPDTRFHLAIGEDNWNLRHEWKDFDGISSLADIIIIGRGTDISTFFPLPDISSTFIRNCLKIGKNVDYLLPRGLEPFLEYYTT